jgi:hypothetical protein
MKPKSNAASNRNPFGPWALRLSKLEKLGAVGGLFAFAGRPGISTQLAPADSPRVARP